jgi:hypothetical protein
MGAGGRPAATTVRAIKSGSGFVRNADHSGFSGGVSPSGNGTCATFSTIDTRL